MVWGFESPPRTTNNTVRRPATGRPSRSHYLEEEPWPLLLKPLKSSSAKITLSLPLTAIQSEVDSRLKRLARTVKMDGFRPGKVPMNVVAQRYGYSVQYEVLNDKVGEAFAQAANEANLRARASPASPRRKAPLKAR